MACVFSRVLGAWSTLDTVFALCADLISGLPLAVDSEKGRGWDCLGPIVGSG